MAAGQRYTSASLQLKADVEFTYPNLTPAEMEDILGRYPLLTHEDVRYIYQLGVPPGLRRSLVDLVDGRIEFTEKGLQFYSFACGRCGFAFSADDIRTEEDLGLLSWQIGARTLELIEAEIAQCMADGRIPLQDVELAQAILNGDPEEFVQASRRNRECQAAGENVIPVKFKR